MVNPTLRNLQIKLVLSSEDVLFFSRISQLFSVLLLQFWRFIRCFYILFIIFLHQAKIVVYLHSLLRKRLRCGVEQLVARRAHNPKVVSSSLAPATKTRVAFRDSFLFYGQTRSLSTHAAAWKSGPRYKEFKAAFSDFVRLWPDEKFIHARSCVEVWPPLQRIQSR
jgi:hypothetical protein